MSSGEPGSLKEQVLSSFEKEHQKAFVGKVIDQIEKEGHWSFQSLKVDAIAAGFSAEKANEAKVLVWRLIQYGYVTFDRNWRVEFGDKTSRGLSTEVAQTEPDTGGNGSSLERRDTEEQRLARMYN